MAFSFLRWKLLDPTNGDTYTFYPNPREMSSPFPSRNVSVLGTSAIDGQALLYEGYRIPKDFTFSGSTLTAQHYEALRAWVYDRSGRRVYLTDHYGRRMTVVLKEFAPTPKRSIGKYWRHEYTCTALVLDISAPTVTGEGI